MLILSLAGKQAPLEKATQHTMKQIGGFPSTWKTVKPAEQKYGWLAAMHHT